MSINITDVCCVTELCHFCHHIFDMLCDAMQEDEQVPYHIPHLPPNLSCRLGWHQTLVLQCRREQGHVVHGT